MYSLYEKREAMVMLIVAVVTIVSNLLLNVPIIQADQFDLKTTLLKHREQHTNHLNVRQCVYILSFYCIGAAIYSLIVA